MLVNPPPEHPISGEEDFVVIERRNAEVEEFSRPFGGKEMESGGESCGALRMEPGGASSAA